jgi:GT2 family glycosyltransferase
MDLSIVIVSWNVRELLRENLDAIFKSVGVISFEVFVVDNKSGDGTVEMVSREFPQVNLIANNYNEFKFFFNDS